MDIQQDRNEPLRRGAGQAHIVEQLYRVAGELVYVCSKYPNGVSEAEYGDGNGDHAQRSVYRLTINS